ncbi:sialic acid-binding Ig-like lectin 14 [Lemur catta]|uniref:sialic acid-binding Ig-like lectin 14 n=1 Tax=Lemur catta TaxID=9447 RepID=UPI001E26B0EF|nr:sialic acid-binding Ig-like lectin 14 [Lemur catta]XP_045388564.1 sialic acid-binding Ig-like lectin 14 [Lemur catta]
MLALLLLPLLWGGSLQDTGYQLQVKKSVTVQEGLCVLVPCSFSYPPWTSWYAFNPVYLHWFRDEDRIYYNDVVATNKPNRAVKTGTKGRFLLLGDVRTRNCSLSIRDAKIEDTGTYFFQVESSNSAKHTYENDKLYLQVTALTEKPDIHSLEPVESGRPTNLSCSLPGSCEGGRPLTFSWTGAALKSLDPDTLHSSAITLTPRPQDHGTNLTCQVKLQGSHVTTERTVQLNVSYAPRNLTISIFRNGTVLKILNDGTSLPVLEGQSLSLICVVDSNPPARLSWSREGKTLDPPQASAPGVLELLSVGAGDGGEFTCGAQHPLGSQHLSLSLSVQRSPSGCRCVTEEQEGSRALVITLLRGALMGAGFLLTYGLTWIYYTRLAKLPLSREAQ